MRISRLEVHNFRNFKNLELSLSDHAVIVGENKVGKSNLVHALRLVLDPSLPDSSRQLREEDYWDGVLRPVTKDDFITVSVDLIEFEKDPKQLALLCDYLVSTEPMISRLTYVFGPIGGEEGALTESNFDFFIFGGQDHDNRVGSEVRRRLPLDVLGALRDAESDLATWRRSPLRPLLDDASSRINPSDLKNIADEVTHATAAVTQNSEISGLASRISGRLRKMVGVAQSLETTLGFSPTDPDRLLRALRLFIDGGRRSVSEASLGSANLLYLTLKLLELDYLVEERTRDHTFLAIEEPEAHLHPYLERLVYRDVLQRRKHQEGVQQAEPAPDMTILLTTHSPHVVSVSPLKSLVVLKKSKDGKSTEGASVADLQFATSDEQDLERYVDVTRGEIFFARGVLLVEGDAEVYLIPSLARLLGYDLDEQGVVVSSVSGTNFSPYAKLLGQKGLNIPFAILTDRDPGAIGSTGKDRVLRLLSEMVSPGALSGKNEAQQLHLAQQNGIFLNAHTLEIDIFKSGQHASMCATLKELTANGAAKKRADAWSADPNSMDPLRLLADITAIGKGRYAQALASRFKGPSCPPYISDAIKHVSSKC